MIMKNLLLVLLVLLPAACATSSAATDGTKDPAYEKAQQAKWDRYRKGRLNAQDRVRRGRLLPQELGRVLLDCDALLRDYFESRKAPGNTRVESFIVSVRKALWQLVAANFPRIMIAAEDTKYGQNRAVALVALGFTEREEQRSQVLTPLLNALNLKDPELVSSACLGLGELKDNRTPPLLLGDLLNDNKKDVSIRLNACWALSQLQDVYETAEKKQLLSIWMRILRRPADNVNNKVDPAILTPVVRGLGLFRNPEHAKMMERYTTDPTPSVRRNAAVALGRMGNQESHKALLKMIGPNESNANVRLAARKALQALAGGLDGKYEVEKWKRVFTRKK